MTDDIVQTVSSQLHTVTRKGELTDEMGSSPPEKWGESLN